MYVQHYTPSKAPSTGKLTKHVLLWAAIITWFIAAPILSALN